MDSGDSVYLQYSPERVFIFRRQNNLFALQAVLAIMTCKHKRTHYCAMRDYIIAHIKPIADSSITIKVQPCTAPRSHSGLFPVVLHHDSDSSAARFIATVVISSVYKHKSGSDTRWEIMRFKGMFPSFFSPLFTLNIVTRSLRISQSVKSQCG